MASKTTKTRKIRNRKESNKGKERKRVSRRDGTTPSFDVLFGDN